MKKVLILAALVMVGAGIAYSGSVTVPWFVDTWGLTNAGLPPDLKGVIGLIYLHNNQQSVISCSIMYYSENGDALGPYAPANNSFTIQPNATISFRPVATDPASAGKGQESLSGLMVPNRPPYNGPITSVIGAMSDARGNGSAVISWIGGSGLVQGIYTQTQNVDGVSTGRVLQWGTLLPPGV